MWSLWTPLGRISGHTPCTDCKVKKPQTHFLAEVVLSLAWHFTVFHGDLAFSSRSKFTKSYSFKKNFDSFSVHYCSGGGGGDIWQIIISINITIIYYYYYYSIKTIGRRWFHLTTKLHFDISPLTNNNNNNINNNKWDINE